MDSILGIITWITSNLDTIGVAVMATVTAASAIAAVTPTPSDDEFIGKIYKFLIDIPALNVGKAKEKSEDA